MRVVTARPERSAIEAPHMRAANSSSAQKVAFTQAGYFSGSLRQASGPAIRRSEMAIEQGPRL